MDNLICFQYLNFSELQMTSFHICVELLHLNITCISLLRNQWHHHVWVFDDNVFDIVTCCTFSLYGNLCINTILIIYLNG